LAEHLAMIDAIEKRDATLADRLAREHVQGLLTQTLNSSNNIR
jgi:DNA-binding GntR family transcriptional regulator